MTASCCYPFYRAADGEQLKEVWVVDVFEKDLYQLIGRSKFFKKLVEQGQEVYESSELFEKDSFEADIKDQTMLYLALSSARPSGFKVEAVLLAHWLYEYDPHDEEAYKRKPAIGLAAYAGRSRRAARRTLELFLEDWKGVGLVAAAIHDWNIKSQKTFTTTAKAKGRDVEWSVAETSTSLRVYHAKAKTLQKGGRTPDSTRRLPKKKKKKNK